MNLNLENLPRTIWVEKSGGVPAVGFVDQRLLPSELILMRTSDWREVVDAVKTLAVRGMCNNRLQRYPVHLFWHRLQCRYATRLPW